MSQMTYIWIFFNVFVVGMIIFDQFLHRDDHVSSIKESLIWTGIWISIALLFNLGIYFHPLGGKEKAIDFLTGYLIEKSLSVDNLFVFLVIFSFFKVPNKYQHRVLFWGIIGALVLRLVFILAGVALIHKFHWIIYVFGAFLVYTGIKLALKKDTEVHPENNPVIKLFKKFFRVSDQYDGHNFFTRKKGVRYATPLFIVLIVIETTDVIFATDSIPAILAITTDPFIVYSSNVFAILGLRALYFALEGVMGMFRYLNYGLSFVLSFVGVKMLTGDFYKIPSLAAFGVIVVILTASILASVMLPEKKKS